ncbi:MAG TPA: phospholipase C, phosphocholine-specific [Opitutaceae bacterium]|jgi:phospholipase C
MPAADEGPLDSRREFLRKAALLAAGGSVAGTLAASIQKAFAIEPAPGTTFRDAEHVVILMQENRSFDHVYGTLQGVRGFNDPRAVALPNGNPVWYQTDARGDTYGPFRLDLRNTCATWMGELPHGRRDQGEARNQGRHDRWLVAKTVEDKAYAGVPLSLGYYSREDLPFHYGLADAFTVCDQAFCSVLGPTTPNRLHLWTGTVRPDKTAASRAHVQNEDTDFGAEVSWTTFPERLEANGITWRTYQNELAVASGLEGDWDAWLSNFGDNPLEFFTQYGVYFAEPHRRHLAATEKALVAELAGLDAVAASLSEAQVKRRFEARDELAKTRRDRQRWTAEAFAVLPAGARALHERAFTTNRDLADYRELSTLSYRDSGVERTMRVPKGDVLHRFREDVRADRLPMVSWIVPPERFSDHPSNPWYGALLLSETLDILTREPQVWRKTIFILCYDENDGYFDHVPPFVPPRPERAGSGKASPGIETASEHVREDPAMGPDDEGPGREGRDGPIGLGYRVPLVVASPWSRGGYVCSEVFDHTSILRFLEVFLSGKTGRPVKETNISSWRRAICGDLTSAFRPYHGQAIPGPASVARDAYLAEINGAQYRPVPNTFHKLGDRELHRIAQAGPPARQEPGVRPSCALPYELSVDGNLDESREAFVIRFSAGRKLFAGRSAGAPFHVYTPSETRRDGPGGARFEKGRTWAYAVGAGAAVQDAWRLADFADGAYLLRVHGPNGFFREFCGGREDPSLEISLCPTVSPGQSTAEAQLVLTNGDLGRSLTVSVDDLSYGQGRRSVVLAPSGRPGAVATVGLALGKSFGWYDLEVGIEGHPLFHQRLAGRIEGGEESITDPLMGNRSLNA